MKFIWTVPFFAKESREWDTIQLKREETFSLPSIMDHDGYWMINSVALEVDVNVIMGLGDRIPGSVRVILQGSVTSRQSRNGEADATPSIQCTLLSISTVVHICMNLFVIIPRFQSPCLSR